MHSRVGLEHPGGEVLLERGEGREAPPGQGIALHMYTADSVWTPRRDPQIRAGGAGNRSTPIDDTSG
jgi:hypothetical protein